MIKTEKLSGLFIGTSGWSYKHWSGIFYPENIKPNQYLEYYITRFQCVELNASFYHLPKPTTVAGWIKRSPDTFLFCPKLNRYITHQMRLSNTNEAMKKYFDVFKEMKNQLGPVLIQLPPGFKFDKPLMVNFLDMIKDQYSHYRFAIEVRHESWLNDKFFDLLEQYQIAFVIADSGKRFPYHEAVTTNFIYLRFHGNEKLYASNYNESQLVFFANKIINWLNEEKEIWIFFNNDYHGYAIQDAVRLREIISKMINLPDKDIT